MEDNNHSDCGVAIGVNPMPPQKSFDDESTSKYPYIPNCVLLEIVCRLPPKLLFQFKCVSKFWNSQIKDQSFIKFYLSRHKDSSPWTLLLRFERRTTREDNNDEEVIPPFVTSNHSSFNALRDFFPIPSEEQKFTCLASSGHLLLFQSLSGSDFNFNFVVCNPFVKQSIQLPPIPPTQQTLRIRRQNDVGFISHVHNGVAHYKVVTIIIENVYRETILPLAIFSSVSGKWEIVRVTLPEPENLITSMTPRSWNVVTCNGIFHWTEPSFSGILAYDTNNRTEYFRFIRMPSGPFIKGKKVQLLEEWQGRLRYFEACNVQPQMLVNWRVWVLKDYKKGLWSLEQWNFDKMDISYIYACDDLNLSWLCRPIAFHPLDRNIMYFQGRGKILQYNFSSKLFENPFNSKLFENPFNGIIVDAALVPIQCSVLSILSILLPPWPTAPIAQPRWRTEDEYTTRVVGGKQKKGTMQKILKFFKPRGDT